MSASRLSGPLVSVLTPSFNQARWLPDTLKSVRQQTYESIEHIVVDGGSTDGSVEILRAAAGKMRWVSEPDDGQADALNKAFGLSHGEIIGWLNSDDAYFSREAVSTVVSVFEREREVDVVYGNAALAGPDGEIFHMIWRPPGLRAVLNIARLDLFIQPAVFVRRRALADGFLDDTMQSAMDHELWIRLARSARFRRVGRVLAIDRHHLQRKVVARPELAAQDFARLKARHGNRAMPERRALGRLATGLCRLIGASLIRFDRADLAFTSPVEPRRVLVRRQLTMRRRSFLVS